MYKLALICLAMVFSWNLSAKDIGDRPFPNDSVGLYLELMKRCISDCVYKDVPQVDYWVRPKNENFYPRFEQTMMGFSEIDKLHELLDDILLHQIPGDFIETGVWRGGMTIFMRAFLKAHQDTTRTVWVADSFQGVPPPNANRYPADKGLDLYAVPWLSVSALEVQKNFRRYGLLDNQVRFLRGWFSQTLPSAPIESLALMRLDGDLYESTMDALENLYPKLSVGGYVIIDDYGCIPACAQAVNDYRKMHQITEEIHWIDWTGVYWQRTLP